MIKLLLVLIFGIFETYLYTGWAITANQKKALVSSILMLSYMAIYLIILDVAFKDANSLLMIADYSLACAIGNYIRVKQESKKK